MAPVAGTWELTFSSVGYNSGGFVPGECTVGATEPACVNPPSNAMINGTWQFEFELPQPTGTVVAPEVSDTVESATVTLTELRITPTTITTRIALRVAGSEVSDWHSMSLVVRHEDTSYIPNSAFHVTQNLADQGPKGDENDFVTNAGSDEPAGTWVIEIPDIEYSIGGGSRLQLAGPWTLTVDVP